MPIFNNKNIHFQKSTILTTPSPNIKQSPHLQSDNTSEISRNLSHLKFIAIVHKLRFRDFDVFEIN